MRIAIESPPYDPSSGGIRVLHYLGFLARRLGCLVDMRTRVLNPEWGRYSQSLGYPDVHIVPEIYPATTPGRTAVVRWVLFFPGAICNGPRLYPPHEMVWSFHADFLAAATEAAAGQEVGIFCLPSSDLPGLELEVERDYPSCFWAGKGNSSGVPEAYTLNTITRAWPSSRAELVNLLKRSHTFYSCDPFTALNYEAAWCGCEVFLWNGATFVPWHADNKFRPMNLEQDTLGVQNFLTQIAAHFGLAF